MSALQVVAVGVTFLLLYRFVRDEIGDAEFGVWAVVLATTSVGHLANLGFAASSVKYVAQYLARDDRSYVTEIIQTAVLAVGAGVGVAALLLYPALQRLLSYVVEPASMIPHALVILPYALTSFWLAAVANVVQSCLDGFHRVYLRNILVIAISVLYLIAAWLLVPRYGLIGLAFAQVVQAATMLLLGWIFLIRVFPALPLVPYRWSRRAFREMLGYSLNFQAISISQMLFEPAAKALISKFGSVSSVANYEFAHRMVFQLRALLATAHQAIVPAISDLNERSPSLLGTLYRRSFELILVIVVVALPLLFALTPLVSVLWIGQPVPEFVLFADLLLVGWFLNLLANPAYFANIGTGRLRWNVTGHVLIGALTLGLGIALGTQFGSTGVVWAVVCALLSGSAVIVIAYHLENDVKAGGIVTGQTLGLGAVAIVAGLLLFAVDSRLAGAVSPWLRLVSMIPLYGLVVLPLLLRHSAFTSVLAWFGKSRSSSHPVR